jgi:hypothetical protein
MSRPKRTAQNEVTTKGIFEAIDYMDVGKPWIDGRPDVELAGEHRAFFFKSFASKTSETS